jgi:DNA-directed RNA polymerase subunit D
MKVDVREHTDNFIKLVIKDTRTSILNPIRRILISELPKMAIEDVEFHLGPIRDETGREYESVTPLFDEIISHRLGLLPIPTDLKIFGFRDACVCKGEGCPNCTIMYTLNKKGPCTVYSRDLEPLGDAKFAIKNGDIPIVKLDDGQAILIYATAILGHGYEHAKWQTVSGASIRYYPKITIDYDICDNGGGCIDVCPKNIMERKGEKIVVGDNFEDCILCDSCVEICVPRQDAEGRKAISVEFDDTQLIFSFETDGSLQALNVLKEAVAIFQNKLSSFNENLNTVLEGPLWEIIEAELEAEEEAAVERAEAEEAASEEEEPPAEEQEPVEIIVGAVADGDEPIPSPDEISIFPEDIEPEEKKVEEKKPEEEKSEEPTEPEEPEEPTEPEEPEEPTEPEEPEEPTEPEEPEEPTEPVEEGESEDKDSTESEGEDTEEEEATE